MSKSDAGSPDAAGTSPDAPEGTEFDLERALWDTDYRRKVLAALRDARLQGAGPVEPRDPVKKRP